MLGNTNLEEQDKKQLDMDVVDEQLDTLGKAFLAQTMGVRAAMIISSIPFPQAITTEWLGFCGMSKRWSTPMSRMDGAPFSARGSARSFVPQTRNCSGQSSGTDQSRKGECQIAGSQVHRTNRAGDAQHHSRQ